MTSEIDGLTGHFPADPTKAIGLLQKCCEGTGSKKDLIHGVYDLAGYVAGTYTEDLKDPVDPAIVKDSCDRLKATLGSPTVTALPPWLKVIVISMLQAVLAWVQSQAVMMHQAHKNTP